MGVGSLSAQPSAARGGCECRCGSSVLTLGRQPGNLGTPSLPRFFIVPADGSIGLPLTAAPPVGGSLSPSVLAPVFDHQRSLQASACLPWSRAMRWLRWRTGLEAVRTRVKASV
jgi:hypothetical protein